MFGFGFVFVERIESTNEKKKKSVLCCVVLLIKNRIALHTPMPMPDARLSVITEMAF